DQALTAGVPEHLRWDADRRRRVAAPFDPAGDQLEVAVAIEVGGVVRAVGGVGGTVHQRVWFEPGGRRHGVAATAVVEQEKRSRASIGADEVEPAVAVEVAGGDASGGGERGNRR